MKKSINENINIAVLFGGCSSEYEVSLQSAYSVLTHMDEEKYNVIPLGITENGQWFKYCGSYENIKKDIWQQDKDKLTPAIISPDRSTRGIIELNLEGNQYTSLDGVFPMLHGKNGEDGTVQGLIQMAGIPLIGCDALSSALCMDKYRAHRLVSHGGINVPRSVVIKNEREKEEVISLIKDLEFPLFVKPVKAGSSMGISKIYDMEEVYPAVIKAFSHDDEVIIEENIEGFEVGFARVDMFLTPDEDIVFNEVNTIPGFTPHSRYPNMMKGISLSFEEIIDHLILLGVGHEED